MNKNTSYYKAMHAKSEAASPLPKIYGTTHNKKMNDSALEAHHPMTKNMEYGSAMPKMDGNAKLGMTQKKDYIPRTVRPPEDITPQTQKDVKAAGEKKVNPLTKKHKEKFKDAETGKTVKIKTRKDGSTKVKVGGKGRGKFEFAPGQNPDDYQLYTR